MSKPELKRKVAYVTVQRGEGDIGIDDFSEHRFDNMDEADSYLNRARLTAPDTDHGYHKADVVVHYEDGTVRRERVDLQRDTYYDIGEQMKREDRFRSEHPELFRSSFDKKGDSRTITRMIDLTSDGTDLDSPSYGVDGHVRIEDDKIEVDVFDRNIKDADEAWIATEEFDNTPEGLKEANRFLKEEGFDAELTRENEHERRLNQGNGGDKNMSEKCAPGEEWVEEYNKDDGTHVKGHCRRKHPHLTRADRRQDAKNLKDRRR
jgi:hypothetical protein